MKNKFLIVIASHNNAQWVDMNISSVMQQDYDNYKVIYFDDASDDGTADKVKELTKDDNRFTMYDLYTERKYKSWYFSNIKVDSENDIIVFLDGDDMFSSENVLSYLNEVYNQSDCWMTYGGMKVWDGVNDPVDPYPQNSEIPDTVKKTKAYRQDIWRTSHLKTMRGFVWNAIDKKDLCPDGSYMVGPDDLAIMFAALELCPPQKIYRVTDPLYIYNHSEANQFSRAFSDHKASKIDYEGMVRNRRPYNTISFVTPTLAGGIGNQMFEIAAAASLAKDNGAVLLVNPEEHILPNQGRNVNNYRDNIFSKIVFEKNLPPIQHVYKREVCTYAPIPYKPNLKIESHCQSWKYFDHNREYIQNLFRVMSKSNIPIDVTAVQVRRGDYYKFPDHHPQLPPEYFMNAVSMTDSKEIHVYSDDLEWCKANLRFNVDTYYINLDLDWIELSAMSECKNLVISNSSFGWWAAYLNKRPDAKVYVPSIWFGKAMVAEGFNIDDLVLPKWIKVNI